MGSRSFRPACLVVLAVAAVTAAAQPVTRTPDEILADLVFDTANSERQLAIDSAATSWQTALDFYRSAIEKFTHARGLYQKTRNRRREGQSLSAVAQLQKVIGETEKALADSQDALDIFRELGDHLGIAEASTTTADIYFQKRDHHKAIYFYKSALDSAARAKDPRLQSLLLTMLGRSYRELGDRRLALSYWERSVKIDEASGNALHLGMTLEMIGSVYHELAEPQKSLSYYSRALTVYSKLPGLAARLKESESIVAVTALIAQLGDFPRTIETLEMGLKLDRAAGFKDKEAEKLMLLGLAYSNLRRTADAIRSFEQALSLYTATANWIGEATVLMQMATVELYSGAPAKALTLAGKALAIAQESGDRMIEAQALDKIGDIVSRIPERRAEEVAFKEKALEIYRDIGDLSSAARLLQALGIAYQSRREDDKAIGYFNDALMMYGVAGLINELDQPLYWLQQAWKAKRNYKFATAYGKEGVRTLQDLRRRIASLDVETQRTYLRSVEDTYRSLTQLLLGQGRLKEAHQAITAFKDQQLLDAADEMVKKSDVDLTFTKREARFFERLLGIMGEITLAKRRLDDLKKATGDREPNRREAGEIEAAETAFTSEWKKYTDFVEIAADEFAKPADEEDLVRSLPESESIWAALNDLPDGTTPTTVAVYQVVDKHGIDSLIVTGDRMRHVHVRAEGIDDKARQFWALLQSDAYDPRDLGKEVYNVVFKPLEKELPAGTKTILWSLDGNLRYIPMAALHDGERYLVERFDHVTFTRAGTLRHKDTRKWTAAAFGSIRPHRVEVGGDITSFSPLPGVNAELTSVFGPGPRSRIVRGSVFLDAAFTRQQMRKILAARPPVVHIASHFSFRPGDETRSYLLLGDGTPFTLAEMKKEKQLFAGVELLTLSACNTAAQQPDANGREVDGFFELAQRLGARSVLATLWPVADNSTPWLMREFYDLKINKGRNKAEALRSAQLALLRGSAKASHSGIRAGAPVKIVVAGDPGSAGGTSTRADKFVVRVKGARPYVTDRARPFAHPFYWSPFVLVGNWR